MLNANCRLLLAAFQNYKSEITNSPVIPTVARRGPRQAQLVGVVAKRRDLALDFAFELERETRNEKPFFTTSQGTASAVPLRIRSGKGMTSVVPNGRPYKGL